jgi:nitrogen fixation protein FixH
MANGGSVVQCDSRPVLGRSWWAFVPAGLLAVLLSIQAVMVALAVSDPSFAIEPSYYQKASNWDRHQREVGASQALGWRTSIRVISTATEDYQVMIELLDSAGHPISGALIEAAYFHNARSALRAHSAFEPTAPGIFSANLPLRRPGLWVFEVQASRGGDHFQQELRVDVR